MKNNLSIPQAIRTYQELLTAIRRTRKSSQLRIEEAVEQEKVREAWETGKLIDEHVLLHKERADYADQTLLRLAKDLATSETELKYMLQFARDYPIRRPADELSWSHYQSLLAINDLEERTVLAQKAKTENWTRDQIREEIRRRKMVKGETLSNVGSRHAWTLQEIPLGTPGTYRIVPGLKRGELVIDLGFSTYYHLPKTSGPRLKAGDHIRFQKGKSLKIPVTSAPELYFYEASVGEVWDGDTFHALIDLGFGITLAQRVRLRRLDAPELVSAEGKQAKAALEKILKRAKDKKILIKTTKSDDQYGRYLVDVWVNGKNIDSELLATELFILRRDA